MTERIRIVTGARAWPDYKSVWRVLAREAPDLVVHGACPNGADDMAERWCKRFSVDFRGMPALWDTDNGFDKAAGHKRNRRMLLAYPGVPVLAFPHGASPGTRGCIAEALRLGHNVRVFDVRGDETELLDWVELHDCKR